MRIDFGTAKAAVAAASILAALAPAARAEEAVRIGAAVTGSVFYTIGVAISDMIRKHGDLNSTVEPLGGSAANMHGLNAKKVEFALANAFASSSAYSGTGPFKGKRMPVRLVMQGQPSYRGMLVAKDEGIEKFSDLLGKTVVARRPPLPELYIVLQAMAKVYGVELDKIKTPMTTTFKEQDTALRTGNAEAGVMAFGARAATIARLLQSGSVVPYYMSKADRDRMMQYLPAAMYPRSLPPKVWPQQTEEWHLVAMNATFMTRADQPAETVYKVTKAILDHVEEFSTYHATARFWTAEQALATFAVPFHDGAIRYFKEQGKWTAEHEARQKALLN